MKSKIFVVAAVIISSRLIAQDSSSVTMDEVVITANKLPQKQSGTGKLISVITKEQIMQSGGKDLSQLLNEQTGIIISGATSNPGTFKSIFMLGATSSYTLILLDGVPLNDPSGVGGNFDLRLLALDNIERIEVLQGSQSTLYGSNAVAGVINIISKKPLATKPKLNGLVSYGTNNSFKGNANVTQKNKWFEYDLNYVYNRTDGISEAKDTTGKAGFDKDGFVQNAVQAILGFQLNDKCKLSPYFRYAGFKGGYDDGAFMDNPADHYTASLFNTGLTGYYKYKTGTLHFNYAYDVTNRTYVSQFSEFATKGKFHQAEAYTEQHVNNNLQLVAGVNYQSFSADDRDTINNMVSSYASFLFSIKNLHVEVGGRYNHHNRYGSNLNYSFNPSLLITRTVKLFFNYSSGFRPPALNEMLPSQYQLENLNLKPETSLSMEGGVQAWLFGKKFSVMASYFDRHLKHAIVYTTDPATFKGLYVNRDQQHDHGAEIELNYRVNESVSFKASYTYIYGEAKEKTDAGKDTVFYNLIRRPKSNIHVFANYRLHQTLFVSGSLQITGASFDTYYDPVSFLPSQVDLRAYALLNLYAEYDFTKNGFRLFVDLKNITNNKNYYEIYGYGVEGINAIAGIRFQL